MDNIKRICLPLKAEPLLIHLEIPKLLVYCKEDPSNGYYEVDEVYAPKILRNMDNLKLINYPSIVDIAKMKFNMTNLPF